MSLMFICYSYHPIVPNSTSLNIFGIMSVRRLARIVILKIERSYGKVVNELAKLAQGTLSTAKRVSQMLLALMTSAV